MQYNHCDKKYDFYSNKIDGRFRVRISSNEVETKCKLSWKRRLNSTTLDEVNKEEEKEVRINPNHIDNFLFIIDNVMHFAMIDSYERYRTVFENDEIEICLKDWNKPFIIICENEENNIQMILPVKGE